MILVLNGPNLNLLGQREPETYGHQNLADLEAMCQRWAQDYGLEVMCKQSNAEGELINAIQEAKAQGFTGLIFNPAGYSHTSVALRDAIAATMLPTIEVHISNIAAREPFRHHSMISAVCIGTIAGLGFEGYQAALLKFQAMQTPA